MDIIRDDLWKTCLTDAMKMHRIDEANDRCYNLADATWKMKMSYIRHSKKRENRQLIVIEKTPSVINEKRTQSVICTAITMAGKQCSFKAVCGEFCKKHRVDKGEIGKKVDISKIKISD
jgi:transcription initiation factor TFIIIB Brf1 subunit/transcription initiation factor TFIIB|tara:strand:- start:1555 stop:1911 length:357 start_codon:yes stop_codon:yes gene_type:complete